MRVLEPHHFISKKKKRFRWPARRELIALGLMLIGSVMLGYVIFGQKLTDSVSNSESPNNSTAETTQETITPKTLKTFNPEQFKSLYSSFAYPNTQPITESPEITGNAEADKRIIKIAAARGYKLSALPVASIVKTNEPGLEGDDLMQPNALIAWQDLKAAAVAAGLKLKLTSAYRSIEYQRGLFSRRLEDAGVNVGRILEGFADDEVDAVLTRAAPPGYSRHHTGYTIDLSCNGVGLEAFIRTSCYTWLSQNNFENTKKFGWVPSYPEGTRLFGPEPEAWEFIWVGTTVLYE